MKCAYRIYSNNSILATVIGFDQSDIYGGKMIIPENVEEISISDKYINFQAEVDEIVLPQSLNKVDSRAFLKIKAKTINIPTNVIMLIDDIYCPRVFNNTLEKLKLNGGKISASAIMYPNLKKIEIESGTIYAGETKNNIVEEIVFVEGCKNVVVDLSAFSNLQKISFPEQLTSQIKLKAQNGQVALTGLQRDNVLELLKYFPEGYFSVDKKMIDSEFIERAKDSIVQGMAVRQQASDYKNVDADVVLLHSIRSKMKEDEFNQKSSIEPSKNSLDNFNK